MVAECESRGFPNQKTRRSHELHGHNEHRKRQTVGHVRIIWQSQSKRLEWTASKTPYPKPQSQHSQRCMFSSQ